MRRALTLAVLALAGAGCVSAPSVPTDRSATIRGILASTVQLWSERDGGVRRAASGVVVATSLLSRRGWIITTRHFVDPVGATQKIYVRLPGRTTVVAATVAFRSDDHDLALLETEFLDFAPARLKMNASLGDGILLIAFPWGRRFTVVSGVVSQVDSRPGEAGPARMVDASVSYGSSGGGVFDVESGSLVGIVEGYRTAKVAIPEMKERVLEVPVAGETTVIPAATIFRFLMESGLGDFLAQ
jgi:S1-C subfamily serine protease